MQGLTLEEPALFWMPSLSAQRPNRSEPTHDKSPVTSVDRIAIGTPVRALSAAACRVQNASLLDFFEAPSPVLEVHCHAEHEGSIDCRPELPLVFVTSALHLAQ